MVTSTTYGRVGGPPSWWNDAVVIDLITKQEVPRVVEVDTLDGYALVVETDNLGQIELCTGFPLNPCAMCGPSDHVKIKRVFGKFTVIKREEV